MRVKFSARSSAAVSSLFGGQLLLRGLFQLPVQNRLIDLAKRPAEQLHRTLVVFLIDQSFRLTVGALEKFLGDALGGRGLCQFEQAVDLIRRETLCLAALQNFHRFKVETIIDGLTSLPQPLRQQTLPILPRYALRECRLQAEQLLISRHPYQSRANTPDSFFRRQLRGTLANLPDEQLVFQLLNAGFKIKPEPEERRVIGKFLERLRQFR